MINKISPYQVLMPFGKCKDMSLGYIKDSNPGYLKWLAHSDGIPKKWQEAAMCVLHGKSIDHLQLPKSEFTAGHPIAKVWAINDSTLGVSFDYDKELLTRFKFEIDGRTWNADERHWRIPAVHLPKLVSLFGGTRNIEGDARTKELYREEVKRRSDLDTIRVSEDTELEVLTKVKLYPYQRVAIDFIERAGGRALDADAPGLGKTPTAIGYSVYKKYKTIIVCPKSVVPHWMREIERFAGKKAVMWSSEGRQGRSDAQFHVINYDIVHKHLKEINECEFDLLVCDEATNLKNRNTLRAKSILGFWKERRKYPGIKAKSCIFLTGTPVMNRPIEAFHLLNYLDKQRFNNFYHFTQRYGGWKGEETKNLDELHERVKDLVIRRKKSEVQKELPSKQRNNLYVEMTTSDMEEYIKYLKDLFRKWRSNGKPTVAEMPSIQKFLITKKMPRAIEMIDEMLSSDRGILVFSVYIEPLKQLLKHYGKEAAMVYGQMSSKERQHSIDRLKTGDAKIGLFSIGAGSMGIDGLQDKLDVCMFLDRWWTPSTHEQAEDRLHRIGQENTVQVFYMTCENTIDEYMAKILEEKQRIVDTITDGKFLGPNINKSYFREFVEALKKDYDEINNIKVNDVDEDLLI